MITNNPKKYDVAVLGWWYGVNYGSMLTYYALNRAISKLGYKVVMVHETLGYDKWRIKWSDAIEPMNFARRVGYNFTEQVHYEEMPALNALAGTFIVGSDQLWNPNIGRVNNDLFLDFVSEENRRIAYATSFGNKSINKFKADFTSRHSRDLKQFDAISVRESYGVDTAKEVFGVDAVSVVDPVFLLPKSDYEDLAKGATARPVGPYLASFFLDPTSEKRRVAEAIADKLGLHKILVIPNPDRGRAMAAEIFAGERFELLGADAPEEFLAAYINSDYVVTDSFHGTAFAVILEKPFSSVYNVKRGADRFINLLHPLGFGDSRRLYETDDHASIRANPDVSFGADFSNANTWLDREKARSLRWLKDALTAPKRAPQMAPLDRGPAQKGLVGVAAASLPAVTASPGGWRIDARDDHTRLQVVAGQSVRGNRVNVPLPKPLRKGSHSRLSLDWVLRTTAPAVNIHLRNPATGTFKVIGKVAVGDQRNVRRNDTLSFTVPDDGYTELMLGAVHFTGPEAGADIMNVDLQESSPAGVNASPNAPKKTPGHSEQVNVLSRANAARQIEIYLQSRKTRSVSGTRARLMFHAHAIEKGLSRTNFRPGFGGIAVPGLARELNFWLDAGRDPDDTFFRAGAAVMRSYFSRHLSLNFDVSSFRILFAPQVQALIDTADQEAGGVLQAVSQREALVRPLDADRGFLEIVYGRRSVREFTDAPVDDESIRRAVQIALQAPSVCNRQGTRVHLFRDPELIAKALAHQGGFSGYAPPPRLMLLTADLEAFMFATERRQPFVDGGLFMMALLLGLERMGLGSCSLNTAMGVERENAIRKLLGIPNAEVFICFVAAGHFDPKITVPRSKRVSVDAVLVSHDHSP